MNRLEQNIPTPSELVYLFVDGETSDVETSLLFSALAEDSTLQEELADAIRINAAAQSEAFETLPPAAVGAALFAKAGIPFESTRASATTGGTLGAAGILAASAGSDAVTPNAGTSTIESDNPLSVPVVEETTRRPIFVPMLAGFFGALLAFVLVDVTDLGGLFDGDSDLDRIAVTAGESQGSADRSFAAPRLSEASTLQQSDGALPDGSRDELIGDADEVHSTQRSSTATSSLLAAGGGPSGRHNGSAARSTQTERSTKSTTTSLDRSVPANAADLDASSAVEVSHRDPVIATNDPARSAAAARAVSASNATNESPKISRSITPIRRPAPPTRALDIRPDPLVPVVLDQTKSTRSAGPISLVLRSGGANSLYPFRSANSQPAAGEFDNLSIAGYWRLDEHHAIGLVASRDYHPLYVGADGGPVVQDPGNNDTPIINGAGGGGGGIDLNGGGIGQNGLLPPDSGGYSTIDGTVDNQYALDRTVEWIGISYRLRTDPIDRGGFIRPQFEATLGAATSGPVGRTFAGLAITPGGPLALTIGVEGSGLLYRRDGTWYSSRAIGLEYGLEINW